MDHEAWLQVVPDYEDKDRIRLSREAEFKYYQVEYDKAPLPTNGRYLLSYFRHSGRFLQTTGGPTPLTWTELESFDRANQLDMTVWEKRLLMQMSITHVNGLTKHKAPDSPPPYVSEEDPLGKRREALRT